MYDELTGLYYLNARYYNPGTATFITQDSYRGEQKDYGTWNLYAYCGGNPVNFVETSGHDAIGQPDMWLCKHIVNSPSYIGAELYLRKRKGWKYSADFWEHSLQNNPRDLAYGYDSELSIKLGRHKKIKAKFKRFQKSGKNKKEYRIIFKKGDMFRAFHRAKLIFERKSKDYVSCVLTDRYDFKCEYPTSLTMVANDYAWFSYNICVKMWMAKKKITLLKKGRKNDKKDSSINSYCINHICRM